MNQTNEKACNPSNKFKHTPVCRSITVHCACTTHYLWHYWSVGLHTALFSHAVYRWPMYYVMSRRPPFGALWFLGRLKRPLKTDRWPINGTDHCERDVRCWLGPFFAHIPGIFLAFCNFRIEIKTSPSVIGCLIKTRRVDRKCRPNPEALAPRVWT